MGGNSAGKRAQVLTFSPYLLSLSPSLLLWMSSRSPAGSVCSASLFSCLVQAGRKSAPVPSHLKRRLLRSFLPDHRDCQQRHGDFLYLCLLRLRKPLKAVFLPPCFEKNHIKKARLKLFCPDVPFPATIFSAFITGFCTPQSLRRLLHNKRRSPLALHTR